MVDDIYQRLDVRDSAIFVTAVKTHQFGGILVVECMYWGTDPHRQFELIFEDCSKIEWEINDDYKGIDTEADVIGVDFDDDHYQAAIQTDIFAIQVLYRKLTINKIGDWSNLSFTS